MIQAVHKRRVENKRKTKKINTNVGRITFHVGHIKGAKCMAGYGFVVWIVEH